MKVIQPNCRVQFTAEDIDFILSVLRPKAGSADGLIELLDSRRRGEPRSDPGRRRAAAGRCWSIGSRLRISAHFYFYLLVRQVFRRSGIMERAAADYAGREVLDRVLTDSSARSAG